MTWNKLLSSLSRILVASTVLGAFLQSVTRGVARTKKLTRKWSVVVLPPPNILKSRMRNGAFWCNLKWCFWKWNCWEKIKDAKCCILTLLIRCFRKLELLRNFLSRGRLMVHSAAIWNNLFVQLNQLRCAPKTLLAGQLGVGHGPSMPPVDPPLRIL